jgi:ribonucleoside-triphosphate reductase
VDKVHKYHTAYREILLDFEAQGMLPAYTAGFISFDKQFSTIGINGLVEAAEFVGIEPSNNKKYKDFVDVILEVLYTKNKKMPFKCNTEMVPAENLGVKNSKWDEEDGYEVKRECYNSYFYRVEDASVNVFDKFVMHGNEFVRYLDGGSALHLNLDEHLTKEQYTKLINLAVTTGCNYFCINVRATVCNTCNHIDKKTLQTCSHCGSPDIDYATRIIGYLKKVSSFSSPRKREEALRFYTLEKASSK